VSAPRYLPAFVVERGVVEGGAAGYHLRGIALEIAVAVREPVGEFPEYDAFDQYGDAIGYLRVEADLLRLSGPYLEATAPYPRTGGSVEFYDEEYLVMTVEQVESGFAVTVPDRRLALRLAAATVVALDQTVFEAGRRA
jgi:hypothetical protein